MQQIGGRDNPHQLLIVNHWQSVKLVICQYFCQAPDGQMNRNFHWISLHYRFNFYLRMGCNSLHPVFCLFVTCILRHKQLHHLFIEQYLNQSYQKREQGFGFLECVILEVCF